MKDYDYHRDSWPAIVSDCYAHGGRMFAVVEICDGNGRVMEYKQTDELNEAAALEHRGMTVVVYGNIIGDK